MIFLKDRPVEDQLAPITRSFEFEGLGAHDVCLPRYLWDVLEYYSSLTAMRPAVTVQLFSRLYEPILQAVDKGRSKRVAIPPVGVQNFIEYDLLAIINRVKNFYYKPANDHDRYHDTAREQVLGVWDAEAIRRRNEHSHDLSGRLHALMGGELRARHLLNHQQHIYEIVESALAIASKKTWTVNGLAGQVPSRHPDNRPPPDRHPRLAALRRSFTEYVARLTIYLRVRLMPSAPLLVLVEERRYFERARAISNR